MGTYELDLATGTWADLTPASMDDRPPGRSAYAVVYDTCRQVVVLFGGLLRDGGLTGETWEWDGAAQTWTNPAPATAPEARSEHAMAFDAARCRTVLAGGLVPGVSSFDDTWEWDGAAWVEGAALPARSRGHTMVYAPSREQVLLYGGQLDTQVLGDLLAWDGAAWSSLGAGDPGPRRGADLAWDSARDVLVFFDGRADPFGDNLGDLWEWDGAAWSELSPSPLPPAGTAPGSQLAYHASDDALVLARQRDTWIHADLPDDPTDGGGLPPVGHPGGCCSSSSAGSGEAASGWVLLGLAWLAARSRRRAAKGGMVRPQTQARR
jgi:MYXO-CTERM domain-containing protein